MALETGAGVRPAPNARSDSVYLKQLFSRGEYRCCANKWSGVLSLLLVFVSAGRAADDVKITPDVVYGHKYGMALTFDVYTPAKDANGAGVLFMVSGGWYSRWNPPEKAMGLFKPMLDAGFTVFAVRHGSSPKFSIPEAVADVRRSVRYIRAHADQFGIDARSIGSLWNECRRASLVGARYDRR